MYLASLTLLFVIGHIVPKTSFLTTIDKLVISSIITQFGLGVSCWLSI